MQITKLGNRVFTTKELRMKELWIEKHAKETNGKYDRIMEKAQAVAAIESWETEMKNKFKAEFGREFNLTKDQKKALEAILTSKNGVIVIQGDAGVGKTTLLQALKEITEDKGIKLPGLSTTAKAVVEMVEQGKIDESMTIDSHILRNKGKKEFIDSNGKKMYITDESSMNATVKLYDVMDIAAKENARIILIGDFKQLPSIQTGGEFERMQKSKHVTFVEMTESIRQTDPFFKEVVKKFAQGNIADGFKMLDNAKMIHEITPELDEKGQKTQEEKSLKEKLFDEITDAYIKDGNLDNFILAAENKDRCELNEIARTKLKKIGLVEMEDFRMGVRETKSLGNEDKKRVWNYQEGDIVVRGKNVYKVKNVDIENKMLLVVDVYSGKEISMTPKKDNEVYVGAERKFSKRDKIIFLKNDYPLGVENGKTGRITDIEKLDDDNYKIEVLVGKKIISFETKDYSYFTHGYAMTVYKAQGQTAIKAFIYATLTTLNEIYVDLSRAKIGAEIWTLSKETLFKTAKNDDRQMSSLDVEKRHWRPYTILNLSGGYENIVSTISDIGSDIGEKIKGFKERIKKMNERENQKEKNVIEEKQDKPKEKILTENINKTVNKKPAKMRHK